MMSWAIVLSCGAIGAGLEKSRDFGRGDGRGSGGLVGVVFLLSST